jgi:hypothetical protein
VDDQEWFREEIAWSEAKTLRRDKNLKLTAGPHTVSFEVIPAGKAAEPAPSGDKPAAEKTGPNGTATRVDVRVANVVIKGPLDPKHWAVPANYSRFFPKGPAPSSTTARANYAREILADFATKAFRRPVDSDHLKRLVEIARSTYLQPGKTFEEGVLADSLPTIEVSAAEFDAGIGVLTAFVKVGLVASTGEARRQIKGGGLRLNDAAVSDERATLQGSDLTGDGVVKLSLGKKKHVLLRRS